MGNHKFKLCDLMPNAWFYKLKNMRRASGNHPIKRTHPQRSPKPHHPPPPHHPLIPNRASYHFRRASDSDNLPHSPTNPKIPDTHFPVDPPRKSKRKTRRPPSKLLTSSVSPSGCSCRTWTSESMNEFPPVVVTSQEDCYEFNGTDIIIDIVNDRSLAPKLDKVIAASEPELPPILTKPSKKAGAKLETAEKMSNHDASRIHVKKQSKSPAKRSPTGVHRIRVRASSPRLASKRNQAHRASRSSGLSQSFAVVKSSSNPQRDFRDSMVEMIVEYNIRASRDLEELLACYLTLNSKEYHDVIVKVFEQIWFELTKIIRV